jgi:hypothetical protein
MGDYLDFKRNVLNTPHPMFGAMPPGFGVGDLPARYNDGFLVFNAVTGDQTSAAIPVDANAIELVATFSDLHTGCTITVLAADGVTPLAVFPGVSTLKSSNLYAGFAENNQLLGGGSFLFAVSAWSGTGTLTLKVRRTG